MFLCTGFYYEWMNEFECQHPALVVVMCINMEGKGLSHRRKSIIDCAEGDIAPERGGFMATRGCLFGIVCLNN